ncbi:hypothetical protein AGMMS4952_19810 [Spirochaetia bacterium]|nr:hypothetical protein AGMMS4952_19810 [Spirochaetia bacterium]
MKTKSALLLLLALCLSLTWCNNVIHDLVPWDAEEGDGLPTTPSYTVRFDKNGGTTDASPAAKTVIPPAATIDALPATDPTWAGHTFEGWWTENGSGGNWGTAFTASTPVTADITVYAQWTANIYTVRFDRNSGTTDASPAAKTVIPPAATIDALPAIDPTWAGHAFEGWWTENGFGGNWGREFTASTPVTADITVYAKWNPPPNYYTVTFNKNSTDSGSTEADPQTAVVTDGGTVNPLPTAPARTGYTFAGWNRAANGSGTAFDETTTVTANITVYAKWTANTYTVTFDKNGGTTDASPAVKTVTVPTTTIDALPTAAPTWAGHTFEGWWTKNGDGGDWGIEFTATTTVSANITVYAKWNPPPNYYLVTFNKNNTDSGSTEANPRTASVADGGTVNPLPTQPARTGYTFVGWNRAADGSGTVFDATTVVTANITVYAQWTINTYTVTFDKNGGDTDASPASNTTTYGGTVSLPTAPAKTGYTFGGWNTAANGSGTVFDATTTVTGNLTVYAQWTINSYTVTFDKNGGDTDASPAVKTVTVPATRIDALPTTASTWAGHTFEGWWTKNGDGGDWGGAFTATTTVSANITVYAKWNPPPNYYKVTFNKNNTDSGSTEANPQTASVADGGTVNPLPAQPARLGYTFAGWNTAANGSGTLFDATTTVAANITVYAKWTANTYTVTFDKNNTDSGSTEASPNTRGPVTHGVHGDVRRYRR